MGTTTTARRTAGTGTDGCHARGGSTGVADPLRAGKVDGAHVRVALVGAPNVGMDAELAGRIRVVTDAPDA